MGKQENLEAMVEGFDFDRFVKRDNVEFGGSVLRKRFDKSDGKDGWHVDDMYIYFLNPRDHRSRNFAKGFKEQGKGVLEGFNLNSYFMIIEKNKHTHFRGCPQRDMSREYLFRELIPVTKSEKDGVIEIFRKDGYLSGRSIYNLRGYGDRYQGPISETKRHGQGEYPHPYMMTKEDFDKVISKFEREKDFASKVEYLYGLRDKFWDNSMGQLFGFEAKGTSHYIEKPIEQEDLVADRRRNGVKTVTSESVVRPGDFMIVYAFGDGSYTFINGGLFDLFGRMSDFSKSNVENMMQSFYKANGFRCIRVYDGLASEVTVNEKGNWIREFSGKSEREVLHTLDRRFGAKYKVDDAPVVSLFPHTMGKMYLPRQNKMIPSEDFPELLKR